LTLLSNAGHAQPGNFFTVQVALQAVRDLEVIPYFTSSSDNQGPFDYSLKQIEQAYTLLTACSDVTGAVRF
jgi:hypothetical protein